MSKQRSTAVALLSAVALSACGSGAGPTEPAVAATAAPGDTQAPSTRSVTTVGVGTSTASPDVLHADVGVEVVADELPAAFTAANEAAQRVIDELQQRGVAPEDIQTSELSVRDRRTGPPPPEGGPPDVTGYAVRNMLTVTVRDVDRAADVLAGVVEAGGDAARVQHLRFALEDDTALQRQARERAVEQARSKAEQYAELVGAELGEVIAIGDAGGPGPLPGPADARAEAAAPPLAPGRSTVSVQVHTTWELR